MDAVIVVSALFGLVAFGRTVKRFERRHFWSFIILILLVLGFGVVLDVAGNRIGNKMGPTLETLEAASSP